MNPYESLTPRSFWRTAVAERDLPLVGELWTPRFTLGQDDVILTAGSCFAAQIGRALLERGMNWRDAEVAPPGLTAAERRARHYGEFSFRTGNIYTAAMLRQWLAWAFGESSPPDETWNENGRHVDPLRPSVEPGGYDSATATLAARDATLAAIRSAVTAAHCFIFTLGMTEAWQDRVSGVVYPSCPGTVRGTFDAGRHAFRNFTFGEVSSDLTAAIAIARRANPGLRFLLTVSPHPLTATATGGHALTANTYSKSVLRAVTGQLVQDHDGVDYFPSFEIITGIPAKARFFGPNLRTVTPEGVEEVMRHFMAALADRPADPSPLQGGEDFHCDDAVLDYYNR
ncbi:MAG: GSCFA domain-containing protein [Kibdelosporangium sp.]